MREHETWLKQAENELRSARILLASSDDCAVSTLLYLSQQVAEKALKGYLKFQQQSPKKTHDLVKLVELCMYFDQDFSMLLPHAQELNPLSIDTRYPDSNFFMPDMSIAHHSIKQAAEVVEFVRNKIYG